MPETKEQEVTESTYIFPKEITDAVQQIREYCEKTKPNFHYVLGIAHGDVTGEDKGVDVFCSSQGAAAVHMEIISVLKDRALRKTLGTLLKEILTSIPDDGPEDVKTS